MLTLEIVEQTGEVFCFYKPRSSHPNVGGYFGRVTKDGTFKGISYKKLVELGTGSHMVVVDEKADCKKGIDQEVRDEYAWLKFAYRHGVITEHELEIHRRKITTDARLLARLCGLLGSKEIKSCT